jgi:hypothetical protein
LIEGVEYGCLELGHAKDVATDLSVMIPYVTITVKDTITE